MNNTKERKHKKVSPQGITEATNLDKMFQIIGSRHMNGQEATSPASKEERNVNDMAVRRSTRQTTSPKQFGEFVMGTTQMETMQSM